MKYLEDIKLLDLRFSNGMLMLPYIRYKLMCSINQDNTSASIKKRISRIIVLKRLLSNLSKFAIRRKNLVYFSSTLFNIESEKNKGTFYNSLDGYYYNIFPNDSLLIEDADENMSWRTKDSYDSLSFVNTFLLCISSLLANIFNKIKPIHVSDFDYLEKKYTGVFSMIELGRIDYFCRIYSYLIKRILKKIGCRLIAVNCGTYGQAYALLIKAAHDLGIKVIEIQHGAITANHLAYHADSFIVQDKEFATYIPDCLYTFGDYWKQYIGWKYDIVSVGNPHLNNHVARYANEEVAIDYLVISQPSLRNDLLAFVNELASNFVEKSIVVRLHPRDDIDFYRKSFESIPNVSFSFSSVNLYKDISRSHYVIGGYSTCLFEALAFHKSPIIIDTPLVRKYFPANIGIWVKTVSELENKQKEITSVDTSYFWADDFDNKVKRLLQEYTN